MPVNNLIGEFGPSLATDRMNEFLREAERVHLVKGSLRQRSKLAGLRGQLLWLRRKPSESSVPLVEFTADEMAVESDPLAS